MSKQARTIRFVEFAQGNRLLHSATGGTLLHLRVGAIIQKFGNFTDWLCVERLLLFMWHMVVNYIAWTTWFNGKLNHFVLVLPIADQTCHTFCLLTTWNKILRWKRNSWLFMETRLITAFTTSRHSLSCAKWIQSTSSFPVFFKLHITISSSSKWSHPFRISY